MKCILLILLFASFSCVSYAGDQTYDWILKQYNRGNTSVISAHTEGKVYGVRYIAIIANRMSPNQEYDPSILIFKKTKEKISPIAKITLQYDDANGYSVAIKNDSIYLESWVAHHGLFGIRYQFKKIGKTFKMIGAENQSQTSGCYTGAESNYCGRYDFWAGTNYNFLTSKLICWQKKININDVKGLTEASQGLKMFLRANSGVIHQMEFPPIEPQYLDNFDLFNVTLPKACFFDIKNKLQLPPTQP